MKVMYINAYFKLPENFEGSIEEALEECIKYIKSENSPKQISDALSFNIESKNINIISYREKFWDVFIEGLSRGFKLLMSYNLSYYKEDKAEWEEINSN